MAEQELAPYTRHELLVTSPRPKLPPVAASAFERVSHIAADARHPVAQRLLFLIWLICNLHRYDEMRWVMPRGAARPTMPQLLAQIAGRRVSILPTAGPALRRDDLEGGRALPERSQPAEVPAMGNLPPMRIADGGNLPERPCAELPRTASVTDARFHAAFDLPADQPPLLLTMIDAEEAFDWSRPFDRTASDVSSMAAQQLAHRVFERHGVVPLYLVDYPVASQDSGRAPLRELLRGANCDIGAQMHPWVTPPFIEEINDRNSYAGNLALELELAKARRLTDTLARSFGEAPQIYRTGRFGAGARTADILKHLGYTADTSVTPCWPAVGITKSWIHSAQPYWADRERTLLELPVSAALVGRLAETRLARLAPAAFDGWANRIRVPGALSHLGLLERIRLSPEGMTIEEAKRLVLHMLRHGHRIFVLTYHSPSLVPGNTPYVRDADQLARFLDWLDGFYAFFREEVGGRPARWREVRHPAPAQQPQAAQ